ncbi:endogenous retrovirus group PABLB member 1 Env polyprotein-like [Myxocyprinus asiaticus]|uniref:endogenous retrovirus group PABLB member 1 Env polyprotein-like n=1 Tax=Myxocyprinus asiaticus TaxID=70543 RepID=UPI0022213F05|nr:endogenous retrovirus group PABLB member 1 Env polyprotein-like [Myxocyprinus asiaticus]
MCYYLVLRQHKCLAIKCTCKSPSTSSTRIKKGNENTVYPEECENQTIALPSIELYEDQTIVVADFFWVCGKEQLMASLPLGWKGICVRVRLIHEITMAQWELGQFIKEDRNRTKRAYKTDPNVFIDSIGQPSGIPNEFKARDEVKADFESIFIWIKQNKNTEWINYIYCNQQRFINYTDDALTALGQQVHETSRKTWQNRQALNWLLADKWGVCVMFGDQCCTFIPNNTAPGGTFSEVMIKLKNLRTEVKANAGRDNQMWDWFDLKLGEWEAWFAKLGMFLGIAIMIGGLLFCCVLPLLRSLIIKAMVKQMEMLRCQDNGRVILEGNQSVYYQDWLYKPNWDSQTLDEDSSTSNEDEEDE